MHVYFEKEHLMLICFIFEKWGTVCSFWNTNYRKWSIGKCTETSDSQPKDKPTASSGWSLGNHSILILEVRGKLLVMVLQWPQDSAANRWAHPGSGQLCSVGGSTGREYVLWKRTFNVTMFHIWKKIREGLFFFKSQTKKHSKMCRN